MQACLGWVRVALATATVLFLTPALAVDDNFGLSTEKGALVAGAANREPVQLDDVRLDLVLHFITPLSK